MNNRQRLEKVIALSQALKNALATASLDAAEPLVEARNTAIREVNWDEVKESEHGQLVASIANLDNQLTALSASLKAAFEKNNEHQPPASEVTISKSNNKAALSKTQSKIRNRYQE